MSEFDVYVDCHVPTPIPLFRLVHFQVERAARGSSLLPEVLRRGAVLSAVYRIGSTRSQAGVPLGYALRLLVDPRVYARPQTVTASAN